jgi:hypothetical protein
VSENLTDNDGTSDGTMKGKTFDFASSSSKQLITLATGVVAITVTFKNTLGPLPDWAKWVLIMGWVVYLLSIVFGVWTLYALTAQLDATSPSIWKGSVTFPSAMQIICFLVATALVVIASIAGFASPTSVSPDDQVPRERSDRVVLLGEQPSDLASVRLSF